MPTPRSRVRPRLQSWPPQRSSRWRRLAFPLTFLAGGFTFLVLPSLVARGAGAGDGSGVPARLSSGPPIGFRDTGPADLFRAGDLRSALLRIAPDARGLTFERSADGRAQFVLNRRVTPSHPELHADWDDLFLIQGGMGTIYYGGRLSGAEQRNPKEWVGGRLDGARAVEVGPGDVLRLPAGVPHAVAPLGDAPLVYLVVKNRAPVQRVAVADTTIADREHAEPARGGWQAKPR